MHTLHLYLDAMDNHHIDRAIKHLEITKPHYVNLTAASRYDQAPGVIERIRAAVPGIRVIWRGWRDEGWRDEGMWLKHTPQEWYDYRVKPHLDFLKKHRVILLADNESGMNDVKGYAQWQADVMELLAKDGLQLAALRTSTGTPNEDRYVDFEVAYRAMAKHGGILSPNEYASNVDSESAGNLERFKRHLEQFDRLKLPRPPIVIGEFAILKHIWLPYDGYSTFGLGGREYAQRILSLIKAWYEPYGAWVCLYSFGKWGSLGVQDDEDYLDEIEKHYIAHPNPPIPAIGTPPPPPIIIPPKDTAPFVPIPSDLGEPLTAQVLEVGYRVYATSAVSDISVGALRLGERFEWYPRVTENDGMNKWYFVRRLDLPPKGESKVGWTNYAPNPNSAPPPIDYSVQIAALEAVADSTNILITDVDIQIVAAAKSMDALKARREKLAASHKRLIEVIASLIKLAA